MINLPPILTTLYKFRWRIIANGRMDGEYLGIDGVKFYENISLVRLIEAEYDF